MNRLLSLLIGLLTVCCVMAQTSSTLNGVWNISFPDSVGVHAQDVNVPHTYNIMDGLEDYAGKATYSRKFTIPKEMTGRHLRIHFNGVYHSARVLVNGKEAGRHNFAGFTPFSFDITDLVNPDGDNILTVECNNTFSENNLPWMRTFDWANDGGIIREVTLKAYGPHGLRFVHVTPTVNLTDSTASARFDLKLWTNPIAVIDVNITVRDKAAGKVVVSRRMPLRYDKKAGTYSTNMKFGKVKLWHFDNPNLYNFTIEVYDKKGNLSDRLTDDFGFRTIKIDGNRILLNGEPVRLPGIENMAGSNPDFGMAESHEYMDFTIGQMKRLNATITRYHWPQDNHRFEVMDSLGILVQEELPWWQLPWKELTPELRESAHRQIEEMIEAHYNHPSIYCWGVSNEVADNTEEVLALRDFIHQRDTTRLVTTMTNHLWQQYEKDPSFALDLPTMNEYIGTWHADNRSQLAGILTKVGDVIKDRPLLITEAGLCEPAFAGGDSRRIDEMIYHVSEWQKHPYITGYIYFSLEDYRTQMGEEGIGRDRVRRHGVCDKRLNPKPSFYVLRQIMSPVEITSVKPYGEKADESSLANIYSLDRSTPDAEITVKTKNTIPSYTLRGYKVKYPDRNGVEHFIDLPDMQPGSSHKVVLKNINKEYHFMVIRPNGSSVFDY